ncbi:hypothetical protein GALMADRAFT_156175 [Galerina marginata CBS 339.88]|uniref:Hydrophobin n=1 Tax=Galerina marginata (strain CBS 339.88) TaxID=685588 RepID=A0A067T0W4_GALM3|nr:hypothetical protein GALMADRAFT_156175 [Galerina marginata CBS 339.88]
MQFINITAFVLCIFTGQALAVAVAGPEVQELAARQGRPVSFNVAPLGTSCGDGTTISCSPSPGSPCKGNFNPKQASIVVTKAADPEPLPNQPPTNPLFLRQSPAARMAVPQTAVSARPEIATAKRSIMLLTVQSWASCFNNLYFDINCVV